MITSSLIIDLIDPVAQQAELVGAKAAVLAQLSHITVIPRGFVIPTSAFIEFIAYHKNNKWIERVAHATTEHELQIIQREIARAEFPKSLYKELKHFLSELDVPSLVCRSSANYEDQNQRSAAGLYKSVLGVPRRASSIAQAIKIVWASLFNDAALKYTANQGIDPYNLSISVIIQETIPAYAAGVAFSIDPLSPKSNRAVIEATLGLGTALVSGIIEPDRFTVSSGGIISSEIVRKRYMFWVQPGLDSQLPGDRFGITLRESHYQAVFLKYALGNIAFVRPVPPLCDIPSLADNEVMRIMQLIKDVQNLPWINEVDIEWALSSTNLYAIQARPITAITNFDSTKSFGQNKANGLQGRPIAPGLVYGQITYESDVINTNMETILVVHYIYPKHLSLIHKVAGLIVETGGALSHGAILCRELGKPCVQITGIQKMRRLLEGKQVKLDAVHGFLEILEN